MGGLLQTKREFPQHHKHHTNPSKIHPQVQVWGLVLIPNPKIASVKSSRTMCSRTCWASTTSTSEHKIHQQSKHEVFCLFSFFLNQHRNLHPNAARPKGKIHQKLKPDVPQNPLSNHAFQKNCQDSERKQEIVSKTGVGLAIIHAVYFFKLYIAIYSFWLYRRFSKCQDLDGWIRDRCHTCPIFT